MEYLTKEQILGADDIGYQDVEVPEWGGTVRIRGLSGDERDRYEQSLVRFVGNAAVPHLDGARSRLVAWSIVDAGGKRQFKDREVKELGVKSAQALDRVYEACRHLSGLSDEAVEELEGNSEGVPSESSTSS